MIETQVGSVSVTTSIDRGHPAEFYANRLVERLIYVSENAPEPIRAQALNYKDAMLAVAVDAFQRAMRSEHNTMAAKLRKAGMAEAAALIAKG